MIQVHPHRPSRSKDLLKLLQTQIDTNDYRLFRPFVFLGSYAVASFISILSRYKQRDIKAAFASPFFTGTLHFVSLALSFIEYRYSMASINMLSVISSVLLQLILHDLLLLQGTSNR